MQTVSRRKSQGKLPFAQYILNQTLPLRKITIQHIVQDWTFENLIYFGKEECLQFSAGLLVHYLPSGAISASCVLVFLVSETTSKNS